MGLVPSEGETEKCLSPSLFLCPSPPLFLLSSLSLHFSVPLFLPLSVSLSLCSAPGEEAVLMPGRQWSAGSLLWNFQPPERGGCDCLLCKPPICLRSLLGAEPREDLCPPLPLCHRHAAVLAGSFLPCVPGTVLPRISGSLPRRRVRAGEEHPPVVWGAEWAQTRLPWADFGVYSCVSLGAPGIQMRG